MFVELYREEKMEERDRDGQEDKRGERKGERQIQLVISSLSVLHRLEYTEIQRVGYRREGEKGDRGDLVERKESPKGERAIKPVISLPSKNR